MSSGSETEYPGGELVTSSGDRSTALSATMADQLATFGGGAIQPQQMLHNFKGKPADVWAMKAAASGDNAESAKDYVNQVIPIRFWMVHTAWINSDNGVDRIPVVRTVLYAPDLTPIAFTSEGAYRGLQELVSFFGPGPYDPPLEVKLRSVNVAGGRQYYVFVPPTC